MLTANSQTRGAPPIPVLSDALLGLVTRRMWLLADPVRVKLLSLLGSREASVQRLTDELGSTTHQNVSRNLNLLYREGVLARRSEGTQALYSLADYTTGHLLEQAVRTVAAQIEELGELTSN